MEHLWTDTRFALRQLARNPLFASAAVMTMALGVAANAIVFALAESVILRPLPYADPGRLVEVSAVMAGAGRVPLANQEFLDVREVRGPFAQVVLTAAISGNLTGVDVSERIESRAVSGDFFTMLNVAPALGRVFGAADERPGITEIAVISHRLWQRRFGGRPDVIGTTLRLDDDPYTIVGVMPPEFSHPGETHAAPVEFWYPAGFRGTPFPPPTRRQREGVTIGRLAPGLTMERAQAMLSATAREMAAKFGDAYPPGSDFDIRVRPLDEALTGGARTPLAVLAAAVACVLLIACTNVASLQLARGVSRTTEFAVRQAHGAPASRLVRQLLTEGLVLSALAGAAGIALAWAGVTLLRAELAAMLPRAGGMRLDAAVVALSLGAAVVAGLVTGLAPALAARKRDIAATLRSGGRGSSGGRAHARVRAALVVAELALSLALLVGAGLMVRSLASLARVEPGFDPEGLATIQLAISYPNEPSRGRWVAPAARTGYFREVLRRVAEVPGVESVGGVSDLPFSQETVVREVTADGRAVTGPADILRVEVRSASPDWFRAMRIPLLAGRGITEQDEMEAPRVAVISRTLARRLAPNGPPSGAGVIGQRIKFGPAASPAPWMTVVGVVGDVRAEALDVAPREQVYASLLQSPPVVLSLALRARAGTTPASLTTAVERAVRAADPEQPVFAARSMTELMGAASSQRRVTLLGLTAFAALAVALALVGTYGLVSYTVAQRAREFGVRMALGARPADLVRLVVGHGARLALAGIAAGTLLALAGARALRALLFGVSSTDPTTFAVLAASLLALVTLASLLPGRRAARMSPAVSLRGE